jgi:hypothetical protein
MQLATTGDIARRAGRGKRLELAGLEPRHRRCRVGKLITVCPASTAETSSAPLLNGMCWNFEPVFWLKSSVVSWNTADVLA